MVLNVMRTHSLQSAEELIRCGEPAMIRRVFEQGYAQREKTHYRSDAFVGCSDAGLAEGVEHVAEEGLVGFRHDVRLSEVLGSYPLVCRVLVLELEDAALCLECLVILRDRTGLAVVFDHGHGILSVY